MKNLHKISWIIVTLLGSVVCCAQNGVFLTKDDFLKNNTSYELNCDGAKSLKNEFNYLMDDKVVVINDAKELKPTSSDTVLTDSLVSSSKRFASSTRLSFIS